MSWFRVFWSWALLAVIMTMNGIFRELVIRPAIGADAAQGVSVLLGTAIILAGTALLFRPLRAAPLQRVIAVSAAIVALTVAFEFSVGHWVDGKSWSTLASSYAFWRGEPWPFMLAILALTPFMWGRWFVRGPRHAH